MKEGDYIKIKKNWREIIRNEITNPTEPEINDIINKYKEIENKYFYIKEVYNFCRLCSVVFNGKKTYLFMNSVMVINNTDKLTDYCYSDFLIDTNTKGVI